MRSSRLLLCGLIASLLLATSAPAGILHFTAQIDGPQAANCAGTGSPATGVGIFTLDTSTNVVNYDISYSGLLGTETAAHVHGAAPACAPAGITYPLPAGNPKIGSVTLNQADRQAMIDGLHYVNIHTTLHAGGEIRGQILETAAPPAFFFGLPHSPLGNAQLSTDAGGNLVVSNIGSSGKDGVSIDIGDGGTCDYLVFQFDPGPPSSLPIGALVTTTSLGAPPPAGPGVLTVLETENTGTDFIVRNSWDFQTPDAVRLDALLGDTVVDSVLLTPPFPIDLAVMAIEGCIIDPFWAMDDAVCVIIDFGQPGQTTLFGSNPVQADRLIIAGLFPAGSTFPFMTGVEVRGADVPQLVFFDEALGFRENEHHALGQAQMSASGGHLTISNIGSSGKDGVSIDLDDVQNGFEALVQPIDLPSPGNGLELSAVGTAGGSPNTFLGNAILQNNGTALELTADFSPVGSSLVRVEILDAGTLSGSVVLPGGLLGIIQPGPLGLGLNKCGKLGGQTTCLVACTDFPFSFQTSGQAPIVGNELRVLVENPTLPISSISQFSIHASSIGQFELIDELVLPPPAGPIFPFGLPHTSLGEATLSDSGGTLTVSNIGSSGKDGVSIDVGQLYNSFDLTMQLDPAGLLEGTLIDALLSVELDGGIPSSMSMRAEMLPGPVPLVQITPDFSPLGATTSSVHLFLDGELVFSQSGLSGPGCRYPPPPVVRAACGRPPGGTKVRTAMEFPAGPLPVTIPGGPTVLADRMVLEPDCPVPPPVLMFISRVDITGLCPLWDPADILFTLVDEVVGCHDVGYRALGEAHMSPSGGHLTVSNIGSSGKDGVSIDLGPLTISNIGSSGEDGVSIDLSPVEVDDDGDALFVSAVGTVGGGTGSGLGSAGCQNVSGQVQIVADLSPLGATNVRLEVFDNGSFVGSAVVPNGLIGTVLPGPGGPPAIVGCGKLRPDPPCFVVNLDPPGTIVPNIPADGPGLVGNQVRLLADDATAPVDDLETFTITPSRIDTIVITDTRHFCAADIAGPEGNGIPDGNVDALDFLLLIAQWGNPGVCPDPPQPPCYADITGPGGGPDGNVDALDFLLLIAQWGNPGNCPLP